MIRPKNHPGQRDEFADLAADLTPLLDVLFILLVFFVLTANSAQVALDLTLPSKGTEAAKPLKDQTKVVVAIYAKDGVVDGAWGVDGARIEAWDKVQAAIEAARKAKPEARFVVAGDREVSLERFLQTLSFLRTLGLEKTDIIMEQR